MIKYIKLAIVLGLLILLVQTFGASAQEFPVCPEGSYNIGETKQDGEIICKIEPTGCPYGDSIPLGPECDKQKPVEKIIPQVQGTIIEKEPVVQSSTVEDYSDIIGK